MLSPSLIAQLSVLISTSIPAIGAIWAIISIGTTMAGAGTEKPEILTRAMIGVVLAEALAIYGLLVGFMLVGALPKLTTEDAAYKALGAALTIAISTVAASFGIAYCGSAMIGAMAERPETFSSNVISVVLSEAVGIYGLLIAFMLISQI